MDKKVGRSGSQIKENDARQCEYMKEYNAKTIIIKIVTDSHAVRHALVRILHIYI